MDDERLTNREEIAISENFCSVIRIFIVVSTTFING